MRLLQIGRDRWTVLAIANPDWSCDLLDALAERSENNLGVRMLALLREYVPSNGVPHNDEISKNLGGGRFEFRRQPNRGPALRVLYFYDEGRYIVCCHAFWKKTDKVPASELERLDCAMMDYTSDKRARKLEIRVWTPPSSGAR